MIPTGLNGRIEGTFLVREILAGRKIVIADEDLRYEDGRHALMGVGFTDELKQDPELSASVEEITEDLIRLFYEAEKDERIRMPLDRIGGTLRPYAGSGDLTGMTLLQFFAYRFVTLEEREDGTFCWKAIRLVQRELPDAKTLLDSLLEDITDFSGRMAGSSKDGAFSGSLKNVRIRENVAGTLSVLHDMMEELDEETDLVRSEDVLSGLTFNNGEYVDVMDLRVQVPDGFRVDPGRDGHRAVLYRPNEENPEVYESSGVIFYLDEDADGQPLITADVRVEESRREETVKQLVSGLRSRVFSR